MESKLEREVRHLKVYVMFSTLLFSPGVAHRASPRGYFTQPLTRIIAFGRRKTR